MRPLHLVRVGDLRRFRALEAEIAQGMSTALAGNGWAVPPEIVQWAGEHYQERLKARCLDWPEWRR